jgi:hypothetical protein
MFKKQKKSADQLADEAIEMADSLTNHIRNLNGNTHTVKAMISDIWHYRENTPFVTTVYEAIQEVKPVSN